MSTVYLSIAAFFILIMILDHIPGIKYFIQPIIGAISFVFSVVFGNLTMWIVWFIKAIYRAHLGYIVHLFSSRGKIDPTHNLEKK